MGRLLFAAVFVLVWSIFGGPLVLILSCVAALLQLAAILVRGITTVLIRFINLPFEVWATEQFGVSS